MKYFKTLVSLLTLLSTISISYSADIPWRVIGHAKNVVAMASTDNMLFAATSDNELWTRRRDLCEVDWWQIGHADNVVAMTAINGRLFAASSDHKLWSREAALRDVDWQYVGHANGVTAMAAINGRIFAASSDNKLWTRIPVLRDVGWQHIGHANGVKGMAAANDLLFASDGSNLWSRDPVLREVDWRRIGHANGVVGMTALTDNDGNSTGPLYAADRGNRFWARDANTFTKEYCDRCKSGAEFVCRNNEGLWGYGYNSRGECYRTCKDFGGYTNSAIIGPEPGSCETFASAQESRRCDN